jgi:hypothetical protein
MLVARRTTPQPKYSVRLEAAPMPQSAGLDTKLYAELGCLRVRPGPLFNEQTHISKASA